MRKNPNAYFGIFAHIMGIFWYFCAYSEHILRFLGIFRAYSGIFAHILGIFWAYSGHIQGIFWAYSGIFGHIQGFLRTFFQKVHLDVIRIITMRKVNIRRIIRILRNRYTGPIAKSTVLIGKSNFFIDLKGGIPFI